MKSTNDLVYGLEVLRDRDDRGSLASLRRGLGQPPGSVMEVNHVVEHMLDDDDPPWTRDTMYVVAPLFALHRLPYEGKRDGNMGDHFRALVGESEEPPTNVERRFIALLSSEPDDLPDTLRQAVSLLKSKDVPVNWCKLFDDVQAWLREGATGEAARREIGLRWSRQFWRLRLPDRKADDVQQPQPQTQL